jgi:prolyl-tRNA synthetase
MLEVYRSFVEDFLAIPLIAGRKSAAERFPGAEETYCIESLMPDGRALQCGTSHYLGQNFAKAFEIQFLDDNNQLQQPHQTSWGVSTRLLGAIVMSHGDDQGLRLPPTVASTQAVVVPIWRKADEATRVLAAARDIAGQLTEAGLRAKCDEREGVTPGFKFNDWEMRGVPLRIEIGPRDVAAGEVVLARRDISGPAGKSKAPLSEAAALAKSMLTEIQANLYRQAKTAAESNTRQFDDYETLRAQMAGEGGGGFAEIYWCGNPACETTIREETRATCRAIPLNLPRNGGRCIVCAQPATERSFFAKAY